MGGCAPAKPAKSLVVPYPIDGAYPNGIGHGRGNATEPRPWSTTEPRVWERRFRSWVKRLASGGCGPKCV